MGVQKEQVFPWTHTSPSSIIISRIYQPGNKIPTHDLGHKTLGTSSQLQSCPLALRGKLEGMCRSLGEHMRKLQVLFTLVL